AHRPRRSNAWSWRSRAFRGLLYQVLAAAIVGGVAWFLWSNTLQNMRVRGIQSGFDFLQQQAGFSIGESLFAFDSAESYLRAFAVGVTNTLRLALAGIVLATVLGVMLGVGRFSRNLLVRSLCAAYVECFRNIPVLLQLLVWYLVLTEYLPGIQDAWKVGPLFLSKGGVNFPVPLWSPGQLGTLAGFAAGLVLAWAYRRWARRAFEATGIPRSMFWWPLALVAAATLLGWVAGGAPTALDVPVKGEFAVENGGALTPEFLALWLGLSLYTAAFIAEVVRSGIASVPGGQSEAAAALGLDRQREIRLVLMPQALRVIIPPLTNQYLNLTKNSSLAVAIGYPDVVSIANTAMNQTGRAVECIAILMAVYLTLSLATSAFMNWYNARVAIQER
ncbi:MAG TPA: ABC transporter permease subunit, partial [Ramlibacter sp.]|nr:ABC transporter permease subunit [Ramlibacter sp.]